MKQNRFLTLLLLGLVVIAGCGRPTSPPPSSTGATTPAIDPIHGHLLQAQPKLPTIKVRVGDQELTAEMARKNVEIATGMMFRTNMPENEAMLFVFPNAAPRSFYMRNCIVPLSAAYINPQGEILQIINMEPHNEMGINSSSDDVQFVLEVPQGWFERHKVGVGTVIQTERGSLHDTFFGGNPPGQ